MPPDPTPRPGDPSSASHQGALDLASKRHFLFDLDGTLVDSSPAHERAYREALASHSKELAETFRYESARGRRTRDVLLEYGLAPALVEKLAGVKQAAYRRLTEGGEVRAFPGAVPLLDKLGAAGRKSYLATGGSRRSTKIILRRCALEAYFADVVTADDVRHGKPSGDTFELIVRRHRLSPSECVVIEDAGSGVAAAREAGLHVVAVYAPELRQADLVLPDLEALGALV